MLSVELADHWVSENDLYQLLERRLCDISVDGVEYHSVRDNLSTVTIYARCAPNKNADVLKKLAEVIDQLAETQQLRSGVDTSGTPASRPAMRVPKRVGSSTESPKRRGPRMAGSPPIGLGRTSSPSADPSAKPTWNHSGHIPL